MNYEKSQNETEILSADEQKLREMCLSLKKADAPKDFNFRLKARIASAKPDDFQPRFGLAFRYALPALALIMVLGLLAYNSGFWTSPNNSIIAGGGSESVNPTSPENTAVSSISSLESKEQPNENSAILLSNKNLPRVPESAVAVRKPKKAEIEVKRRLKENNSGGSILQSQKKVEILQPKGFEQKEILQNPQNIEASNPISVKEVLLINGINANFESGKWKVRSVIANSVAESSGVRENDIIEAIDNQPLAGETIIGKTSGGKTITVTRNGEKSQIKLRNKQ